MNLNSYVSMARPNHWFKNLFIFAGAIFAYAEIRPPLANIPLDMLIGFISTCLVASANYIINEVLDADYDKHHPTKKQRAAVSQDIVVPIAYGLYAVLLVLGILLGFLLVNVQFGITVSTLAVCGILYNVPPIRLKERVYVDVLFESFNNVLRLFLGWVVVAPFIVPPASLVIAFWLAGAFLMAAKRYAEYRYIGDPERAALYRRSFRFYTEKKLLLSAFFFANTFPFFFGIFLYKYKPEFILLFPLFSILFTCYLSLAMLPESPAQNPQSLYKEKTLNIILLVIVSSMVALSFVDIPSIELLLKSTSYSN